MGNNYIFSNMDNDKQLAKYDKSNHFIIEKIASDKEWRMKWWIYIP